MSLLKTLLNLVVLTILIVGISGLLSVYIVPDFTRKSYNCSSEFICGEISGDTGTYSTQQSCLDNCKAPPPPPQQSVVFQPYPVYYGFPTRPIYQRTIYNRPRGIRPRRIRP